MPAGVLGERGGFGSRLGGGLFRGNVVVGGGGAFQGMQADFIHLGLFIHFFFCCFFFLSSKRVLLLSEPRQRDTLFMLIRFILHRIFTVILFSAAPSISNYCCKTQLS